MCFGGSSPAPQAAPAPPPPPPADNPSSPAFNEAATNAANADALVEGARRGRKSMRVDLNTQTGASTATDTGGWSVKTGLNTL